MRFMYDRAYHGKGLDAPGSLRQLPREGQCTVPKRLGNMDGGSANNRTLALVRRTHALIISKSLYGQEIHKETSTPRRSVWGLGYPCASSTHDNVRVLYILQPLRRLVIHIVARVLN